MKILDLNYQINYKSNHSLMRGCGKLTMVRYLLNCLKERKKISSHNATHNTIRTAEHPPQNLGAQFIINYCICNKRVFKWDVIIQLLLPTVTLPEFCCNWKQQSQENSLA